MRKSQSVPPEQVGITKAKGREGKSVRTVLAGVWLLHIELGFPNSIENCWLISSTLKGISHLKGVAPVQKLPIKPDILKQIAHVLNMRDHFQACFGLRV